MYTGELERFTFFTRAYDKRDPNPLKNYGIGCVRCGMVLKGKEGAVHFVFGTGMYLPETHRQWINKPEFRDHDPVRYMGDDVGYHSLIPRFEGQSINKDKCEWLDNKPCYTDGSALRADEWMNILVKEGGEKIWEMLEEDYKERFPLLPNKRSKIKK